MLRMTSKEDVEGEISSNENVLEMIVSRKQEVRNGEILLIALLAFNFLLFFVVQYYCVLWILSSLLACTIIFILFLLPTTKRPVSQGTVNDVGERGKMRKSVLMLMLWDMFFVNSQPLAAGMMFICAMNFPFLLYAVFWENSIPADMLGMMMIQSVMIIGYYLGILYFRPYSSGFLERMRQVGRHVKSTVRRDNLRGSLKVLAILVVVVSGILIVVVYTLLLPGMSLSTLRGKTSEVLVNVFVPWLCIFASQILLIRALQGMDSRKLVIEVLNNRIKTLKEDILPRWQDLDTPTVQPDGRRRITTFRQKFLAMRIFRIKSQDIFGYMPVYLLNPDFNAAKEKEVAEDMEWLSGSDSLEVDMD
jgi:hypothetical protein